MDSQIRAWDSKRPVFSRLPEQGYQDNVVADWFTQDVDAKLVETADIAQHFYLETSPTTCNDASLDWLAYLVGMSGRYWDTRWTATVKRAVITVAYTLFSSKGTKSSLSTFLNIFGFNYSIWTQGALTLPFSLSGTFGSNDMRMFITLPLTYPRSSQPWVESNRSLDCYAPACVKTKVVYKKFYLGFSKLGDPLFY